MNTTTVMQSGDSLLAMPSSPHGFKGTSSPPTSGPTTNPKIRRRSKTGCLTCRKRRIKCGEERPTCANCIKSKRQCEGYNQRVTFKTPLEGCSNHAGVVDTVQYHASILPSIRDLGLQPASPGELGLSTPLNYMQSCSSEAPQLNYHPTRIDEILPEQPLPPTYMLPCPLENHQLNCPPSRIDEILPEPWELWDRDSAYYSSVSPPDLVSPRASVYMFPKRRSRSVSPVTSPSYDNQIEPLGADGDLNMLEWGLSISDCTPPLLIRPNEDPVIRERLPMKQEVDATSPTIQSLEPILLTSSSRFSPVNDSSYERDSPIDPQGGLLGSSESSTDGELDWWSETSSPDPHAYQMLGLMSDMAEAAATSLLNAFTTWCRQRGTGTSETSQSTGSSRFANSNPQDTGAVNSSHDSRGFTGSARKRPADEDDDDDDDKATPRQKLKTSLGRGKTQLLACPFAKNNPMRHSKCYRYMIQEISRLKQHLLRFHQVPIHCARCSTTFRNEDERDAHQRQAPDCIVQPLRSWDGVSESQRRLLARRVSSKKSREENWYLIYQILFPGMPLPESPYIVDSRLSEELLALREFTRHEAPALISEFALHQMPPQLRATQAQVEEFALAAFRGVFEMVVERWSECVISPADSGYESSPARGPTEHQTPALGLQDDAEPSTRPSANSPNQLHLWPDHPDFSIDSVITDLFQKLPQEDDGLDFLTSFES